MALNFLMKNRVKDKDTNWKWEKPAKIKQKNQVPIFFAHFARPLRPLREKIARKGRKGKYAKNAKRSLQLV